MKLNKKKKGFTLIELMAVIAIIAILAAVLVPSINGYVAKSRVTAVRSEARTLVNAAELYNATTSDTTTLLDDNTTVTGICDEADEVSTEQIKKIDYTVTLDVLRDLAEGNIEDDVVTTNLKANGVYK